jgi:glutaredoxin-dependent peroxiredoxin
LWKIDWKFIGNQRKIHTFLFYFLPSKAYQMALSLGQTAPAFTLKTKNADGVSNVSLSDFRGKNVVLLFYPLAFSKTCTEEMCSVSGGLELYTSLAAQVLGISVDSPFAQEIFAQQNGISFPQLSDFNREASRAYDSLYDVLMPGVLDLQGVSKRSAFVIDKEGIIRHIEILEKPGLPDFDAIKNTLQSLQ